LPPPHQPAALHPILFNDQKRFLAFWNALLARVVGVNEGQHMLQLMRSVGTSPNQITYSILFMEAKLWDKIGAVWQAMQSDQLPFFQYHFRKVQNILKAAGTDPAAQLLVELSQRVQP
jgi:hypothetical protein